MGPERRGVYFKKVPSPGQKLYPSIKVSLEGRRDCLPEKERETERGRERGEGVGEGRGCVGEIISIGNIVVK